MKHSGVQTRVRAFIYQMKDVKTKKGLYFSTIVDFSNKHLFRVKRSVRKMVETTEHVFLERGASEHENINQFQ